MTAKNLILAGASSSDTGSWKAIDWLAAESSVRRLQIRIAKAVQQGRHNKVKALQWLLTHSFHAKLLAAKRVTQSRGAKTAGVDGKTYQTPKQKMQLARSLQRRGYQAQPLRRVYIPKKNSVTELRALSIPTLADRAMQALYLLALEPIAEINADPNSYGFRTQRCVADAIEQCFKVLAKKGSAHYILEGDIRKCFDRLDFCWLKTHIPTDKKVLGQWLTAGYMDKDILYPTTRGSAQGGTISPCLALMALSGLEQAIKSAVRPRDKVHAVIYADDFIVTGASKEVLEQKVKPVVITFLRERGLELSETKTKITNINVGFEFLGHQIRKYHGKLLIKPSKRSVKTFLDDIRRTTRKHIARKTVDLINILNPKIRGWANHYRHVVSKEVFCYVDDCIYRALARWVKRRHPEKNATWWRQHYFRCHGSRHWVFSAKDPKEPGQWIDVVRMGYVPISRHVKIIADATPYDRRWKEYFAQREKQKRRRNVIQRRMQSLRTGQSGSKSTKEQLGES
jgi:RNA-directed DNA polymerase